MLGLGTTIPKTGKLGVHDLGIVTSNLVLKHNYDLSSVQPLSDGAASFNESGDDYITMGDQSNLSFGTGSFSVSCWVNSVQTGATRFILSKKGHSGVAGVGYALYLGNSGQDWVFNVADGSDYKTVYLDLDSTANQWHHLCGTFDGVAKTARMYLDGVLVDTDTNTNIGDIDTTQPFQIGRAAADSTYSWDGYVCNVGVWDAILSQTEIKSIMWKNYSQLNADEVGNLVSWWNLSANAKDYHSTNHGTLT